jgi:hypothetical protein
MTPAILIASFFLHLAAYSETIFLRGKGYNFAFLSGGWDLSSDKELIFSLLGMAES